MPNERFTELPAVGSAQLSDIICAVQGFVDTSNLGTSVQETLGQIFQLFVSNTILFHAGNPNGFVAGQTFQLLWDTVDKLLWVCTFTGSSSTAGWTTAVGNFTNGQLLIGSTGVAPQPANLTAGANISIANGPNSITISSTGSAGIGFTDVTGTTQLMVADSGYVADNAGLVTLTLPATAAFGTVLFIQGLGLGGWKIAQNVLQKIIVGSLTSTVGVGGSVASTNANDSLQLLCVVANTTWSAFGGPQSAGLTIV